MILIIIPLETIWDIIEIKIIFLQWISLYSKSQAPASTELKSKKYFKYNDLENLSKEELIDEVIKARVEAERAKKDTKWKEMVRKRNSSI